jgi:hypothetical protein
MFLCGCRKLGSKLLIASVLTKLGPSSAPNARPPRAEANTAGPLPRSLRYGLAMRLRPGSAVA